MTAPRAAPTAPVASARSWFVWIAGAGVYMLAVFNRSTLGVAAGDAMARFHISAGQLGIFVMLQVGLYAAMQIPAGLLVDRFGPRLMLLTAAFVMGIGQLMFALVSTFPTGLIARGVLGCGDALTYVSVLRLLAGWFPGERYALMASFSGLFGVIGNVIATVPLAALLPIWGWGPTFGVAAGCCLAYSALLIRRGKVAPPFITPAAPTANPMGGRRMLGEARRAARVPAGRLSFWLHFTTMSGSAVFTVLWGFPYLNGALGLSRGLASSLLLLLVILQLVFSLTFGWSMGRRPGIRVPLAFIVCFANVLVWTLLVAWPGGHPPLPVLVGVIAILSIGGPSSSVAFMLARDYHPRDRISTATGLANTGGWFATLLGVLLVGVILDLVDSGQVDSAPHTTTGYRWAFAAILALTVFGLFRFAVWWRRVRAELFALQASGGRGPVTVRRHRIDLPPLSTESGETPGVAPDPVRKPGESA